MTDRRHRLARGHRLACQIDHGVPHPHLVGRVAAGDYERVEVAHARFARGQFRRDHGLAVLAAELAARRRANHHDLGASRAQRVQRLGQLAILEIVLDQQRDAPARLCRHRILRRRIVASVRAGPEYAGRPGLRLSVMPNRLARESSPYLLQHANNPVDWYPWGDEAFAQARDRQQPIFLSVGYSTCHWCHVMEHESFESETIAQLLNQHFISIKVDREERPDVDEIYMRAVQLLTGSGGWPMSVFLTPDQKPFWGGT